MSNYPARFYDFLQTEKKYKCKETVHCLINKLTIVLVVADNLKKE